MTRKASPPTSINEAYELQPGDKNNPVWVNNVQGVVLSIKTGRMGAADTWPVVLGNDGGGRSLEVMFWKEPTFATGDLISMDGGLRRSEFKGVQSISVGQSTEVHVIRRGGGSPAESRPAAAARQPVDDTRGGGAGFGPDAGGEHVADDRAVAFHQKMHANAMFYLQCLIYARKINTSLKADGKPELSPDHFQACVSTLFIAGDRQGLAVMPPPVVRVAPAPTPAPEPVRKAAPVEEDVPF